MGQVGHLKMTHLFHPAGPNESPSRGATLDAYDMDATYQFGTDHSAEFDENIQTLEPFYNQLLTTFTITPNP
jgi:hypothetical protein